MARQSPEPPPWRLGAPDKGLTAQARSRRDGFTMFSSAIAPEIPMGPARIPAGMRQLPQAVPLGVPFHIPWQKFAAS